MSLHWWSSCSTRPTLLTFQFGLLGATMMHISTGLMSSCWRWNRVSGCCLLSITQNWSPQVKTVNYLVCCLLIQYWCFALITQRKTSWIMPRLIPKSSTFAQVFARTHNKFNGVIHSGTLSWWRWKTGPKTRISSGRLQSNTTQFGFWTSKTLITPQLQTITCPCFANTTSTST